MFYYVLGDFMTQAIINIGEREDRVLTIVKGKYGLKTKSDAINFVISRFESDILEPHLKPEYVEKISRIKTQKGLAFKDVNSLKTHIKNARI
jgi:hypothetical protein